MSDLEKVKLRKEEKVTFCLGEGNHDKCFFFLNIYIPKSSKGPDDQPKKINPKKTLVGIHFYQRSSWKTKQNNDYLSLVEQRTITIEIQMM